MTFQTYRMPEFTIGALNMLPVPVSEQKGEP